MFCDGARKNDTHKSDQHTTATTVERNTVYCAAENAALLPGDGLVLAIFSPQGYF